MRVSVFGIGHVGAVVGACLARDGHDVLAVDVDASRLRRLAAGRAPVVEPHLDELVAEVVASGRLRAEGDPAAAVASSEIALVCVDTPGGPDGRLALGALETVATTIGEGLRGRSAPFTVAVRSTVPPGTTAEVVAPRLEAASGRRLGQGLHVAAVPEFAREGSAIQDHDDPPYLLVGALGAGAIEPLRALFRRTGVPFIVTDVATAETIKLVSNAWHALKVGFANEVGALCTTLGIDGRAVMDLVCDDAKLNLSRAYLTPGFAFGGPCLGKDLRALASRARDLGLSLPLLASVLPANAAHIARAIEAVAALGRRRLGLLGLSFKPGIADLRESPFMTLAWALLERGFELAIYDADIPLNGDADGYDRLAEVPGALRSLLTGSLGEVMAHAEVLIVAKADERYRPALAFRRPGQSVVELADLGVSGADPVSARRRGVAQ